MNILTRYACFELALLAVGLAVIAACGDEGKAREDLSEELVALHEGNTDVIVSANGYPNFSHTCWEEVGFWSTTDRVALIVYNDWKCEASNREQPMVVLSGNPRDIVRAP